LRAFFRYAETKGWCRQGLATAITAPRIYQDELIPSGPSWEVVQQLLESTATDRPVDIRDHAILKLFAVYGLRSEEVQGLQLKDFDWDREVIHIARPKPRTIQQYPLAPTVGEATLRYLKEVRLQRPSRHVFLTLRAQYGPLSRSALWKAVSDRLRPLKLSIRHRGPHSLRHACATHLLAQGLSLKRSATTWDIGTQNRQASIRDLQHWTRHDRWLLSRRLVFPVLAGLLARLRQQVEGALDAGDHAGGDAGVARRRV
jgi:integrase/recombinase XerD